MLLERHSAPLVNVALAVDCRLRLRHARAGGRRLARARPDRRGHDDARRVPDRRRARRARRAPHHGQPARPVVRSRLRATSENLRPSLAIFADVVLQPVVSRETSSASRRSAGSRRSGRRRRSRTRRRCACCPACSTARGTPTASRSPARAPSSRSTPSPATTSRSGTRTGSSRATRTLIVTGDTTMADAAARARSGVRRVGAGQGARQERSARWRGGAGGRVYLIDKPDAPQSVIVAAHVSEPGGQAGGSGHRDGACATSAAWRPRALTATCGSTSTGATARRAASATRAGSARSSSSRRCRPTRRRSRWSRWRKRFAAWRASARWPARSSRASCAT